ncbi:MAG: hypothetical protein KGZ83_14030 [Sulfuricella sp.]|nr:hypothetical protein [Sulfuricella sp.]
MIRTEHALASYRNYADPYGMAAAASPPAVVNQAGNAGQSSGAQASPSYKVSLSSLGREMSSTVLAKPMENPPFQEPDRQMFANQHSERAKSDARTAQHIAQLNAEYHAISEVRTQKFNAQAQAHDKKLINQMDAMTAQKNAQDAAENRAASKTVSPPTQLEPPPPAPPPDPGKPNTASPGALPPPQSDQP